jgi:hypothetical protein
MKRITFGIALSFLALVASAQGKSTEKNEPTKSADAQLTVTLTGQIGCAHCAFHVASTCADAIRVKDNGQDVVYLFAADPARKHDMAMCKSVRDGKVTGVVSEKDGKKTIKVSKIEFGK